MSDRIQEISKLCSELTPEEIHVITTNRQLILGTLGMMLVPKHWVYCDACGEEMGDDDLAAFGFETRPPFQSCSKCVNCYQCHKPMLAGKDGGIQCVNAYCTSSPEWAKRQKKKSQ
jgi:hypothetical protein